MTSTKGDQPVGSKPARRKRQDKVGRQYVVELLAELEAINPNDLRGTGRFPPQYELRYAPAQFRSILSIAKRYLASKSHSISPSMANGVQKALIDLLAVVDEILLVKADQPGSQRIETSKEGGAKLSSILDFFAAIDTEIEMLEPRREDSRASQGLSPNEIANLQRTRDELEKSRTEIADLEARQAEISAELDARGELVEATRTKTGAAGAKELAVAYEEQAQNHERQWKLWGMGLVLATIVALVVGYLVLYYNHPDKDATTAQIVSHVTVDLLVVGLLIYAVRITSRQFSVHSHLAAVAHNKAAALDTFSRIVSSGSSAEARDRLADVLAQYVFASDNTGFLNGDGDQVTLFERIAGPIGQRLGQSG